MDDVKSSLTQQTQISTNEVISKIKMYRVNYRTLANICQTKRVFEICFVKHVFSTKVLSMLTYDANTKR